MKCSFQDCKKTSKTPTSEGWASLVAWGPGIPDGMYCPEHAAAIEACHDEIFIEQKSIKPKEMPQ
jgi:hypothetical protein